MTMTGLNDTTPGEDAPSRLIPFELMPAGAKYRFFINDLAATHDTFNLNDDLRPEFADWIKSVWLIWIIVCAAFRSPEIIWFHSKSKAPAEKSVCCGASSERIATS
jgi:hypothetical protein